MQTNHEYLIISVVLPFSVYKKFMWTSHVSGPSRLVLGFETFSNVL